MCFIVSYVIGLIPEAELVYPKVKVRQQQDPGDQHGVQDFYSAKEHEDVSPPSVAKIPTSYVPSVAIPSEEAEKKNEKLDEDNQQNIRARSIPRPRAVLSSPDNDLVIGNTNRIKTERRALVVKNHNSVQNRHTGCKAISSHHDEKSMNRKKSKDAQDEGNLKEGKQPLGAALNQRRQPRTQKPSSIRT